MVVVRDAQTGVPAAKTSHTLNPVPFVIHDPRWRGEYRISPALEGKAGLANVSATCLELLGLAPPDDEERSLLEFPR